MANRLAQETSPYLKQHADNPVAWYPWGQEALEAARQQNKPILLSIGYAACHWCHVMAHESFSDPETADLMNRLFINIKVDREERPDLDKIYQTTHYLLTQRSGGWPLTLFLTPNDLIPFFSGTYFPPEARYNLPAFKDVLQRIADSYQHRQHDIQQQNIVLRDILHRSEHMSMDANIQLNDQPIKLAQEKLQQQYDALYGGFGSAPKFPQPTRMEFLLQSHSHMTTETLRHMAQGGMYDQLGGGFYRYATDAKWQIPHFEKMLYDNGQLLFLYALAAQEYSEPFFAAIADETAAWTMNNMQSAEGGYFSSIDADSEGHEGKYYVWKKAEIKSLLTTDEYALAKRYFGLDQPPNFESEWHLFIVQSLESVADHLKISLPTAKELLLSAKEKLYSARSKHIAPHRDEKILTAWNGLMIKGMLTAGQHLQKPELIASAQNALTFIQRHLWRDQHMLACYQTNLMGYLDDYVFLIDALLTSLQFTWNTEHLAFAIQLADLLLNHFQDKINGGFFFTHDNHETLLYRPKTMMDEATPSGNGVVVRVLLTLGYLLGETRYLDAAEKTLRLAWPTLLQFPSEHCTLLLGLQNFLEPPHMIILRGAEDEIKHWQHSCRTSKNMVFAIPHDAQKLPDNLNEKKYLGKTCAYVCQGTHCLDVIKDLHVLKEKTGR